MTMEIVGDFSPSTARAIALSSLAALCGHGVARDGDQGEFI